MKIKQDILPIGLNQNVIKQISQSKNEPDWMLKKRLVAFKVWQKMTEPDWAKLKIKPIDYQAISYQAVPSKFGKFGQKVNKNKQKLITKIEKLKIEIKELKTEINIKLPNQIK